MKKQIVGTLALFSLLIIIAGAGSTASAQGASLVVNVPFEFVAGGESLPAGLYSVGRVTDDSENALMLRRLDGRGRAAVLTHSINGAARGGAQLAFTRYGDRYFLAEVWTPGASSGRAVPRSKSERALRRGLRRLAAAGDARARKAAAGEKVIVSGSLR